MDFDLAVLDYDRLNRAAHGLIANYGQNALAEAVRRAKNMRSAGCEGTAAAWEFICEIIRHRFGVNALVGGAVVSSLPEPEMSERVVTKFSFFDTP